jgi:hypothetical protein
MRKLTLALAAASILAAAAPSAQAATLTVTGGKLEWTMANHYASGDANRTWLGYATNSGAGPQFANGNIVRSDVATLTGPTGAAVDTVDGTTARGVDQLYTLGYPVRAANAGTYTESGVGAIELSGGFTFTIHAAQGVKPITIVDPLITLNGLTGTLTSTGTDSHGAVYDRAKTQFSLDLSKATVTLRADGSRVISGIKPISTADTVLSGFPAGSTLFGTMNLTLALNYPEPGTGPKGDAGEAGQTVFGSPGAQGPAGPAGPAGPKGVRGPAGKSAKISRFTLKKAPFKGSAKRKVKVLQRRTGKLLATGTLKGRKLRVRHLATTKLKGSYVLRVANGKRKATVRLK